MRLDDFVTPTKGKRKGRKGADSADEENEPRAKAKTAAKATKGLKVRALLFCKSNHCAANETIRHHRVLCVRCIRPLPTRMTTLRRRPSETTCRCTIYRAPLCTMSHRQGPYWANEIAAQWRLTGTCPLRSKGEELLFYFVFAVSR